MLETHHTFRFLNAQRVASRIQGQLHLTIAAKGTPNSLPTWVRQATAAAWTLLKPFTKNTPWQVGVRFVEAPEAQAANTQFRSKDYTPDVLSFPTWEPLEGGATYAGDVLICWPILVQHAKTQGKPLKAHTQHLVIHALLHLAGYDHLTPVQAKAMEALEIKILKTLGWPNPYLID